MKIQPLTLPQLADVLEQLTINRTLDQGALLIHEGTHPALGLCITVQDVCIDGAVLIKED